MCHSLCLNLELLEMVTLPLEWQQNVMPLIKMAGCNKKSESEMFMNADEENDDYSISDGSCYVSDSSESSSDLIEVRNLKVYSIICVI